MSTLTTSRPSSSWVGTARGGLPAARSATGAVVTLFVAALVLRLFISIVMFEAIQKATGLARGSDKYEHIGRSLAAGYGYRFAADLSPSMFLPPAYPVFLGGIFSVVPREYQLTATRVAQSALDAGTCVLLYLIAAPRLGRRAALIGAWMYALYPGALIACARYLTEPLFAFLTVGFVYLLGRYLDKGGRWALITAGVACALMVLCKSVAGLLPLFLLGGGLVLPFWFRGCWKRMMRAAVICVVMTVFGVAPWVYRNYAVSGHFVYPTTTGGLALYTAYVYAAHPEQDIRTSVDQAAAEVKALAEANGIRNDPRDGYPRWFYSTEDEVRLDRLARAAALEKISADPTGFVHHIVGNLWRFWFGAPTPTSVVASLAMNGPLMLLAGVGLFCSRFWRKGPISAWVIVGLYLFLGHVTVLAVVRYSLTVMPLVCVLAGAAVCRMLPSPRYAAAKVGSNGVLR